MEADPVSPSDPVGKLIAAHRAYAVAVSGFLADERATIWLREMLADFSLAALTLAATCELEYKIDLLPELVLNLCQGRPAEIGLARNAIRSLPRTEIEQRLSVQMPDIVAGLDAQELAQLANLLVELGVVGGVNQLARYAARQPDPAMHRLAEELNGIRADESRWWWRHGERRQ